jgi:hypothetical protein
VCVQRGGDKMAVFRVFGVVFVAAFKVTRRPKDPKQ